MTTHLQLLLITVAGWVNRQQQAVIEFLQEENRVLLEQLGGKPKRFTDSQRIRIARKAKIIGRRRLGQITTIVTPDTLLRWFRVLVSRKWTYASLNPRGRPPVQPELEALVVKLIQENPTWGSNRICGALSNLGYKLSDSTIDNIRRRSGLEPAPDRDTKYCQAFREILESGGVNIVLCPPRVPQCNAYAERFVRSIKSECLIRLIFLCEKHLQRTISSYVDFYRHRRNHQGIDNKLIEPPGELPTVGQIHCRSELGGMLNYYYREAA